MPKRHQVGVPPQALGMRTSRYDVVWLRVRLLVHWSSPRNFYGEKILDYTTYDAKEVKQDDRLKCSYST
jgi:hypothetical protein